ncbi:MAG: hypothetical protein H6621_08530 [Halobacteriovoraceae bacterium]|nr:hypothetical protein [Halobacteriovoraceae bacterium]MCB9095098.1 hypothetical protein [Halobacteriovoraceae bacterium]
MKKLWLEAKIFKFILILTLSTAAQAYASKFQVLELKGYGFSVSKTGSTKTLKKGEYVYFGDEILVEENSSLSLLGPFDQMLNLQGGSHLKLDYQSYKLIKGSAWIQHKSSKYGSLYFETANALVTVNEGDTIIQYSEQSEKTHVFVLNGNAELSNVYDKYKVAALEDGEFSFIQKDYNDGRPRIATLIGKDSFYKLKRGFPSVKPLSKGGIGEMYAEKKSHSTSEEIQQISQSLANLDNSFQSPENKRGIASVEEQVVPEVRPQLRESNLPSREQRYYFLSSRSKRKFRKKYGLSRVPSSTTIFEEQTETYNSLKSKKSKKQETPVNHYRISWDEKVEASVPMDERIKGNVEAKPFKPKQPIRLPASVKPLKIQNDGNPFEKSLKEKYQDQKKYSEDFDSLINELDSIREDHTESY